MTGWNGVMIVDYCLIYFDFSLVVYSLPNSLISSIPLTPLPPSSSTSFTIARATTSTCKGAGGSGTLAAFGIKDAIGVEREERMEQKPANGIVGVTESEYISPKGEGTKNEVSFTRQGSGLQT